jgi:nicotinate-nucleotide pyrophosphorylase (carboxylating)
VGTGDRTSEALVPVGTRARGRLRAKEPLVVCGLPLLEHIFARLGAVTVTPAVADGDAVRAGAVLATVEGDARALLAAERLVLNFLQHLSGIATLTRACVQKTAGTGLLVRDTRKTVPGLRLLAKYAVRVGGGENHRLALDDALLIKDNHLTLAGGDVAAAVRRARAAFPDLPLEVECRTPAEVAAALEAEPDLILLDNMTREEMKEAVRLAGGLVPLEASGGIEPEDLDTVSATGVEFVAMGALTHSAPAMDINLKLEPVP